MLAARSFVQTAARAIRLDCLARQARCVDGSRSLRRSPGSRRLRRIRRNDRVGESALFSPRFVGSSCRSAARTSRRGSRFESRCLPHSFAASCTRECRLLAEAGRSLVRPDSGAAIRFDCSARCDVGQRLICSLALSRRQTWAASPSDTLVRRLTTANADRRGPQSRAKAHSTFKVRKESRMPNVQ
jgi:hypothetical protein